jgi:uncharacterized protein YjbJ (UPF0337 family)
MERDSWWVQETVGKAHRRRYPPYSRALDQITGIIQQRYGYTRERAEQEIDHFLDAYQDHMEDYGKRIKGYGDQLKDYNDEMQSKARSAVSDAADKAKSPFVKEKKSKRRPWFVIFTGIILAIVVAYLFKQQQAPHSSSGMNDYRTGQ